MKHAEFVAKNLVDAITRGTAAWRKPWRSVGGPRNGISKKPYRGINVFQTALAPFNSPNWFTYNQAKKVGAQVKKGEKGTCVFFWTFIEKEDSEGRKVSKRPFAKLYSVFNEEQIDGLPEKYQYKAEEIGEKGEENKVAERIIADWSQRHCPISYGGNRAFYSPIEDRIQLPSSFISTDGRYSVTFHEMAHATGHKSRLDRDLSGAFGTELYAKEELIAELTSAIVCSTLGIDMEEQAAAYTKAWLRPLGNDTKEIYNAAQAAQKAADLIFNKFQKEEEE